MTKGYLKNLSIVSIASLMLIAALLINNAVRNVHDRSPDSLTVKIGAQMCHFHPLTVFIVFHDQPRKFL